MKYQIKQSKKQDPNIENYWKWSVWLEATDEDLAKVKEVEYILHPTFPNRIRFSRSLKNNFKLQSKGWGEFTIYIKIYTIERDEPYFLNHDLILFSDSYPQNKSVFVSSGLKEKKKVEELKKELEEQNITVNTIDDLETGSSFTDSIHDAIENSDAILILGDHLSKFMEHELNVASELDKEIFAIGNWQSNITKSRQINRINSSDDLINKL